MSTLGSFPALPGVPVLDPSAARSEALVAQLSEIFQGGVQAVGATIESEQEKVANSGREKAARVQNLLLQKRVEAEEIDMANRGTAIELRRTDLQNEQAGRSLSNLIAMDELGYTALSHVLGPEQRAAFESAFPLHHDPATQGQRDRDIADDYARWIQTATEPKIQIMREQQAAEDYYRSVQPDLVKLIGDAQQANPDTPLDELLSADLILGWAEPHAAKMGYHGATHFLGRVTEDLAKQKQDFLIARARLEHEQFLRGTQEQAFSRVRGAVKSGTFTGSELTRLMDEGSQRMNTLGIPATWKDWAQHLFDAAHVLDMNGLNRLDAYARAHPGLDNHMGAGEPFSVRRLMVDYETGRMGPVLDRHVKKVEGEHNRRVHELIVDAQAEPADPTVTPQEWIGGLRLQYEAIQAQLQLEYDNLPSEAQEAADDRFLSMRGDMFTIQQHIGQAVVQAETSALMDAFARPAVGGTSRPLLVPENVSGKNAVAKFDMLSRSSALHDIFPGRHPDAAAWRGMDGMSPGNAGTMLEDFPDLREAFVSQIQSSVFSFGQSEVSVPPEISNEFKAFELYSFLADSMGHAGAVRWSQANLDPAVADGAIAMFYQLKYAGAVNTDGTLDLQHDAFKSMRSQLARGDYTQNIAGVRSDLEGAAEEAKLLEGVADPDNPIHTNLARRAVVQQLARGAGGDKALQLSDTQYSALESLYYGIYAMNSVVRDKGKLVTDLGAVRATHMKRAWQTLTAAEGLAAIKVDNSTKLISEPVLGLEQPGNRITGIARHATGRALAAETTRFKILRNAMRTIPAESAAIATSFRELTKEAMTWAAMATQGPALSAARREIIEMLPLPTLYELWRDRVSQSEVDADLNLPALILDEEAFLLTQPLVDGMVHSYNADPGAYSEEAKALMDMLSKKPGRFTAIPIEIPTGRLGQPEYRYAIWPLDEDDRAELLKRVMDPNASPLRLPSQLTERLSAALAEELERARTNP